MSSADGMTDSQSSACLKLAVLAAEVAKRQRIYTESSLSAEVAKSLPTGSQRPVGPFLEALQLLVTFLDWAAGQGGLQPWRPLVDRKEYIYLKSLDGAQTSSVNESYLGPEVQRRMDRLRTDRNSRTQFQTTLLRVYLVCLRLDYPYPFPTNGTQVRADLISKLEEVLLERPSSQSITQLSVGSSGRRQPLSPWRIVAMAASVLALFSLLIMIFLVQQREDVRLNLQKSSGSLQQKANELGVGPCQPGS